MELGHGTGLGELAGIHHDGPVACLGDHGEVMGDEDDGQTQLPAESLQELQDLRLDHHVEGSGGLITDDQARPTGKGHRDHHPLAHAAAELVGVLHATLGTDAHHLEQLADPRGCCSAAQRGFVDERSAPRPGRPPGGPG